MSYVEPCLDDAVTLATMGTSHISPVDTEQTECIIILNIIFELYFLRKSEENEKLFFERDERQSI